MANPRITLMGLGIMGNGMARRLLGAGFPLTVYNRNPARAEALAAAGARAAPTPRRAVEGAEIVIAMVADDAASRGIWMSDEGALAGVERGALLIESSTLSVTWVKELADAARARECELLDAPVTGSKLNAAAGEITFLVGGSAEALERARPAFAAMGRAAVHAGPTGSGALLKLVNNFMGGVQAASLAEAVALIERSGLDRTTALEVLLNGAPGSPLVKTLAARMTARDYTPNFSLKLMAKDLTYAAQEAQHCGMRLQMASCVLDIITRAIESGHGEQDFAVLVEPLRPQ
jgi:3-hydroxyisobutyrate dehydrogenase